MTPWKTPTTNRQTVCLINTPSPFLLDERVFASLGILKVAAILETVGHQVNFLDLAGIENYTDVLDDYLGQSGDQAFGITATTPQLPAAIKVLARIREARPGVKVILGGPHVTLVYSALKLERGNGVAGGRAARAVARLEEVFDVLCSGDGEIAILKALESGAPKFIDGDDHKSDLFMSDELYTASPYPARHLIDMSSYHYEIEGHNATSLIAQLGCPFYCGFCGGRNSKSLRVVRTRGTESIIGEVELLHREYGHTGFMFYDDELNVNPNMIPLMDELSARQERLGTEVRLRGFIKAELFNEEQARAMRRAGFRWLLCGFEAADPGILVNIEKRATRDDNSRVVEIGKAHDLKVKALMSIGHPGESEATVRAVHDWLVAMDVDDFDCTVITPYPGTPYHDEARPHETEAGVWTYTQPRTGDKLYAYELDYTVTADYYKGIPGGGYESFVFTDYLSSDELVELREWVEKEVRATLDIPFNPSQTAVRYDHSMGQGFSGAVLRSSSPSGPSGPSGAARAAAS